MTKFEQGLMQWLVKRMYASRKGSQVMSNLQALFNTILTEHRGVFYEDNMYDRVLFVQEQLEYACASNHLPSPAKLLIDSTVN